jgi:O-antigen ligase
MTRRPQLIMLCLGALAFPLLIVLAERAPGLFADTTLLAGILALQIALAGLSHFEETFFPLLMLTFLWAGSAVPLSQAAESLRWLFLAVGAFGGFIIWMKSPRTRHFGPFHLVALFCVTSALVSALVSELPETSLLKVSSLFLLFLYASAGARAAIAGRGKQFLAGIVLACEVLAYLSAVCYFVLGFNVFGNPNALGALVGVVALPVLLWGASVAETRGLRKRRFLALMLCGALLYLSESRASILGASVAVLMFTILARYQRLLLQCIFATFFFLTIMAVVSPSHVKDLVSSVTFRVLYKQEDTGHEIFGSRLSPWADTVNVIERHPWFGTGFGTSELGDFRSPWTSSSSVYTERGMNREHGNSYLALAEYLGVVGVLPFIALLFMLIHALGRAFGQIRVSRNPRQLFIPFALVVTAGLVHAFFEDWLFAVGSYVCVFFWISAFLLLDLIPQRNAELSTSPQPQRSPTIVSPLQLTHSPR